MPSFRCSRSSGLGVFLPKSGCGCQRWGSVEGGWDVTTNLCFSRQSPLLTLPRGPGSTMLPRRPWRVKFLRICREDLEELDRALEEATSSASSNFTTLSWFFGLGQWQLFCGRDVLGPQSFGFVSMFNVDQLNAISILNFTCEDEDYELFWDWARIHVWMMGETICMI